MDVLGAIVLGWQLQPRDEAADVAARPWLCETRGFSHRAAERAFTKGDREIRGRSCRVETRRRRARFLPVCNHLGAPLISKPNEHVR